VSERLLITVDKFELKSRDLELKLQTLGLEVKKGDILVNAT